MPKPTKSEAHDAVAALQAFVAAVVPPQSITCEASPKSIAPGETVTLSWSTENALAVHLDGIPVEPIGSVTRAPGEDATYTLVVKGSAPDISCAVSVSVQGVATLATLAPNNARALGTWRTDVFGTGFRSDYSGIVADPANRRILFFGGGHGPGVWDDIRALDLVTFQWSSLYPPTPSAEMVSSNLDKSLARWISTNHPAALHTYNSMCVVDGKLYLMSNGGGGGRTCWYDFADREWHWSKVAYSWYYVCAAVAVGKRILVASSGRQGNGWSELWLYDTVTDSATKLPAQYGIVGTMAPSLVPANGKHYILTPKDVFEFAYDEANPSASTCVKLATTGTPPPSSVYPAYSHDPINKRIGMLTAGTYYALDPVLKAWTSTPVAVEAGSTGVPTTIFHCSATDPESACVIALGGAPQFETWVYRPPSLIVALAATNDPAREGLSLTLDFGGGKVARFSGGVDVGEFVGEFVRQKCRMATDPAFPEWRVFLRPDADGKRDEVVVEYGRSVGGAPVNVTAPYTATIRRGDEVVHTATVPVHWGYARWRWQSAPRPVVRAPAELMRRGWLPKLGEAALWGARTPASVPWAGPMTAPAGMGNVMGAAGDNWQIGLVTEAAGDYAIHGTPGSLVTVRTEGEWYGNAAMHYRADDGSMLDIRGKKLRYKGSGGTLANPLVRVIDPRFIDIETGHWYPAPNMGWLLTDDPYLLEELQFGANWRLLFSAYHRSGQKLEGLMYPGDTRGWAWGVRDLSLLAASSPASVPKWLQPAATWKACLDDNREFAMRYVNSPARAQALFRAWTRYDMVPAWMVAWCSTVAGQCVLQGFDEWRPVFEWSIGSQIAMTNGTSGWNRQYPAPYYWYVVKTALGSIMIPDPAHDSVTFATWKEASDYHLAGSGGRTPVVDVTKLDGVSLMSSNSYSLHVRAALATAVGAAMPGAQASYDFMHAGIAAKAASPDRWVGQARFAVVT